MLQIPDWMDLHADVRPGDEAIVTPRLTLTFGQLRAASVAAALRLQDAGITRGQTAGVQAVNPGLQLVLLLALHRLGVVTCLMPQEIVRRKAGLEAMRFDWLLTDNDEKFCDAKIYPIDLEWLTTLELTAKRLPGGFASADDISLISISSGTTSAPKPMGYTVGVLERRTAWRSLGDQATSRGEKVLILAGMGSMNGFHSCTSALWGGGTVYIGWKPEHVLDVIAEHRIARLFCSSPLLLRVMDALDAKPSDVSSLRQIYAGGDAIPPELSRRVMKRMCRNLLTGFSTNEAGRLALGTVEQMGIRPQDVGFLMPWAEVQAVDENDNVLPQGEEGHLRFKSPCMIHGYYENAAATAERYRDSWFYSDDIGWVTPERVLVISGRKTDFVTVDGKRFNPARIDHAFSGHARIVEAAGFGVPGTDGQDEVWLALAVRTPIEDDELRAFCEAKFGAQAPRHFLRLNALPRTEAGKVMRGKLAEIVAQNRGGG